MKKLIRRKGYTLEVKSWENDGDHSNTKFYYVGEAKDHALAIKHMCDNLFQSCNNGDGGVGNSFGDEGDQIILDYFKQNPKIKKLLFEDKPEDDEHLIDWVRDYAGELLGWSEDYMFRVCESCTITYASEDIEVEIITE